jgi:hypothetical protein
MKEMNHQSNKEDLLDSWKDIAAYLEKEIKTCQRWEKNSGLPVHRYTDSPKSRVFAYIHEIEEWKRSKKKSFLFGKINISESRFLRYRYIFFVTFIISVLTVNLLLKNRKSVPVDFRIINSNLIILNEKDRELWRFDTGFKNLIPEIKYKEHFQFKKLIDNGVTLPLIFFKDLNRDGNIEVLFGVKTQDERKGPVLYYLNHLGELIWGFKSGCELKYGSITYSDDYTVNGFQLVDLNNDGDTEIVLISDHYREFPTQLVILDLKKNKLGEFWNSGRIYDVDFKDLNGDGQLEIILCGINNEYKKGFICILDLQQIEGSSPQIKDYYKCKELPKGTEKYYVLLPTTDVSSLVEDLGGISEINILANDRLLFITKYPSITFEFNRDMAIQSVNTSSKFDLKHKQAVLSGKLNSTLNKQYKEDLKKGILYWNGHEWTTTPSMSNPW